MSNGNNLESVPLRRVCARRSFVFPLLKAIPFLLVSHCYMLNVSCMKVTLVYN